MFSKRLCRQSLTGFILQPIKQNSHLHFGKTMAKFTLNADTWIGTVMTSAALTSMLDSKDKTHKFINGLIEKVDQVNIQVSNIYL